MLAMTPAILVLGAMPPTIMPMLKMDTSTSSVAAQKAEALSHVEPIPERDA